MGTFHSICSRILRKDGRAVGLEPHFVIYDDQDQISLIKRTLQALNIDPKQFAPNAIANAISAAKSHTWTPKEYAQGSRSYFDEVVARVYEQYQKLLDDSNAVDFDDLLMKTVQLLRSNPEPPVSATRRFWRPRAGTLPIVGRSPRELCPAG